MKKALSLFLALVMVALMIPFAAFMTSANGETTVANNVLYSVDFTKMTPNSGVDGSGNLVNISSSLPEEWTVGDDTDKTWATTLSHKGLTLGGSYIVAGINKPISTYTGTSTNYTVVTTWNTDLKFQYLRMGFATTSCSSATTSAQFGFDGGPDRRVDDIPQLFTDRDTGNLFATLNGGAVSKAYDANNKDLTADDIDNLFTPAGTAGATFTTALEIVNNSIAKMYITSADGNTVIWDAPKTATVGDYFNFWLHGDGAGNNTINLKTVEIIDGAYTIPTTVATPNATHSYNVANAADIDAIPWDVLDDADGKMYLDDDAVWYDAKGAKDSAKNYIKVDNELFGNSATYTMDFTLAGGSESRILYVAFGMNDDSSKNYGYTSNNEFKLRLRTYDNSWASDNCKAFKYDPETKQYVQANSSNASKMTDTMIANIQAGSDMNFRIVVINNFFRLAYLEVEGEVVIFRHKYAVNAPAGDISFTQNSRDGNGNCIGIKNITVYDDAIIGIPSAYAGEQIPMPTGKAVVKNNGNATVVNAGTELTDAIAMKTNGIVTDLAPVAAGNVYAPITKADIAAGKLTAADAELRLGANPGMRYKTSFAGSDFDLIMDLTALNTPAIVDVKMGTLVTVDTYLEGAGAFTADALKAYGEAQGKNVYMDITADAAALYAENTFAGSIISVKDFTRNYVARAYITVTFADATTATIYADATDAISIKGLAAAIVAAEYAGYETDAEKAALDFLATFGDVAA